jgi:hypothetical protein
MDGIAILETEIPVETLAEKPLRFRLHQRGTGLREYRFLTHHQSRELPVILNGQFRILPWGCQSVRSMLPRSCWTWENSLRDGSWRQVQVEEAMIPCNLLVMNGYWMNVRKGLRGLVAYDQMGIPAIYVICREPTKYFANATRARWQPLLIDEEEV